VAEVERSGPPVRIAGPDRTGTAFAVVDSIGRFVDISLHPGWWTTLGPERVAAGLLEALETARLKAALVPMILRRSAAPGETVDQPGTLPPPTDDGFLDAARGRIAEAYRMIDDADQRLREQRATRVIAGPRGLFRLYARGSQIDRFEVTRGRLGRSDTDALVADAREALTELTRGRGDL
jgi:hypothetical protein